MTEKNAGPVGFRRPPLASRFQPGRSGNPSGRPKKIRSLRDEVLDELNQPVRLSEGGNAYEITKARAIAKRLLQAAVDGNLRALSILASLCAHPSGDASEQQDQLETPEDLELLDEHIEREIRRRTNAADIEVSASTEAEQDKEDNREKK